MAEFHLTSRWRLSAPVDEVAAILDRTERLGVWWADVYREVTLLHPGDPETGLGKRFEVLARARLPYSLRWQAEVVASDPPRSWTIRATGDLEGQGVWTLSEDPGPVTLADYDWRVAVDKPLLKHLRPVLAPLYAWNHRWAMARGEAGLRRELEDIRAGRVPPP